MPDSSTPNPSDPEDQPQGPDQPDADSSPSEDQPKDQETAKKRPQIRLKRLVVKDMEIHPHKDPDAEPTPEAKPYEEPVEPPVDMSEHPEHKKLDLKKTAAGPEAAPTTEEEPVLEEEREEESGEEQPVKKKHGKASPSRSRRLIKLLSPFFLLAGVLYLVHLFFDPLGLNPPDPIKPSGKLTAFPPAEAASEMQPEEAVPPPSFGLDPAEMSIEEYLRLLGEQELNISQNPPGIFINSVFYGVGSSLNPAVGLTVKSVSTESPVSRLVLEDSNGGQYSVSLN